MQNTPFKIGPTQLSNAAADLLSPGAISGGVGMAQFHDLSCIITHIRVINPSGTIRFAYFWVGGSGGSTAGTEIFFSNSPIPAAGGTARNYDDWYGRYQLNQGQFLTGKADASGALTVEIEGEIRVNG